MTAQVGLASGSVPFLTPVLDGDEGRRAFGSTLARHYCCNWWMLVILLDKVIVLYVRSTQH